jgi:hypothetical protein
MAVLHEIVADLVPVRSPVAAPPGTTVVEQRLRSGVPALFPLSAAFTLAVAFPTGLAVTWRDADPTALVTAGRFERDASSPPPWPTTPGAAARPPLMLVLLDTAASTTGRRPIAAAVAVAGVSRRLPASGRAAVGVSVTMLDWELYAGTVLGAGDFGSWARFAWRPIGPGSDEFDAPPVEPRVRARSSRPDSSTATGPAAADPCGYGPTPATTTLRGWT